MSLRVNETFILTYTKQMADIIQPQHVPSRQRRAILVVFPVRNKFVRVKGIDVNMTTQRKRHRAFPGAAAHHMGGLSSPCALINNVYKEWKTLE
ncbi:hypothetical protein V3C99_007943 [Haemonchus contortus]